MDFRALIVDNGSTDDTTAAVRMAFPQVQIIELEQNKGFAAGANIGLQYALQMGSDYILLLNNDTMVDTRLLEELTAWLAPDVGILAPMIYYADPPDVIWSAGAMRHPWTLEQVNSAQGLRDDRHWPQVVERDFVTGCAMLVSRSMIESIGLFDECFFMYYEDNDLCLRARRAGFRLLLVPQAKMWHKVSVSSGGRDSPSERYHMARASVLFFRKHAHGWQRSIIFPYRLGSAIKTVLRLMLRGRPDAARAYLRGLYHGLQTKLSMRAAGAEKLLDRGIV